MIVETYTTFCKFNIQCEFPPPRSTTAEDIEISFGTVHFFTDSIMLKGGFTDTVRAKPREWSRACE